MIGLMTLHWGEIEQNITVTGGKPASGRLSTRSGRSTGVKASGGTNKVSGSGR